MAKEHGETEEALATKSEDTVHEPPKYRVLMHNDNYTTMDFVVQVLESVFSKPRAEAYEIMLNIHRRGIGMCGVYTAELAETKIATVHHLARQSGFPLKCSMEEV
jgi:ATP-dependent Clp protease adaptor protein ClpS